METGLREIGDLINRITHEDDYVSRARIGLNLMNLFPDLGRDYKRIDIAMAEAIIILIEKGFVADYERLGYERAEGQ